MIIEWKSHNIGHVGFVAEPEDYDGVPRFAQYWLDASPKNRHADREALAAFLIFGKYMGGLTRMPSKFSPAVESVMCRVSAAVSTSFTPIEYYPKGLPIGKRSLRLSWSDTELRGDSEVVDVTRAYLHVDRSDKSSGSLRNINGLRVASNAWMHSEMNPGSIDSIFPYVAAAVLYAEDLDIDTIEISGNYDMQTSEWAKLVHLLGAARLGISCLP